MVTNALSKTTSRMGSFVAISVEERPLARDVYILANNLIHMHIFKEMNCLIA